MDLVGGGNLPQMEKYEFVNWVDYIPNIWKNKGSCSKPPTSIISALHPTNYTGDTMDTFVGSKLTKHKDIQRS